MTAKEAQKKLAALDEAMIRRANMGEKVSFGTILRRNKLAAIAARANKK